MIGLPSVLRRRWMLLALAALLVLGALAAAIIALRAYPVLLVNGDPASARRFATNYAALSTYYQFLRAGASSSTAVPVFSVPELEAQVLDQLVDTLLIERGARREAGGALSAMVEEKVGRYKDRPILRDAAEELYGLSPEELTAEVLVPQAMHDILAGRLFLKGERFDEWLAVERAEARVIILSGKFSWSGGKVVVAR